jgi:outer membrane protein assembly factor BamB
VKKKKMKSAKTKAISKMIFVIAIMLTSALVIETAIAQPADSPWPMSRFDAQGTAKSPYTGPDEPAIKWKFGTGYFVNSAPAIAEDGTIYVASRDDHLYAINPDGSEKWAVEMGFASPNPYLAPAIGEDGTIYITTYGDGILHALHPADGHEIWNVTIGCHICNPVIGDDGTIYLVRIRKGLYAINPDGSIKWQISAYLNMNIALSPDSGTVYLRTGSRKFAAVNAADGSIVWEIEVPLGYEYLAVGPDGTIYAAAYRDHLVALEPISGTQKWDVDIESTLGPPAIDAGRSTVYVFTGNDFLSAITFSGTLKWKLAIGDAWHLDSAPIIGADGTVYVSTDGVGVLYAVDPDTGELKWSISGGNYAPAMGADGTIYLGYSHALNAIGEAEPTIFRNNSYLYVHKSMSWHDAKTYAKSRGGHLVTINDSEEHQFVYRLAGESGKVGKFWIGLTDEVEEGTFTWVTGEPLDFTLWYHTGEPTDEDYGVYSGPRWGTVNESVLRQFMVEFEGTPTPATVTNCIYFNTGAWTNLSSVFTNGTEIYGGTNNKYSGTAYMYLWLSFDSPQANISLRPCPDDIDPQAQDGDPNWGDRAELEVEVIPSNELRSRLTADFVPYELRAGLKGHYIYRTVVTAPDHGYHSSYIFSFGTSPNYAIGWGNVDDSDWLGRVRVCNVGTQ